MQQKYSLQLVKGRSYFFNGVLSVGAYITRNNNAILFDSSFDEQTAKKIDAILKQKELFVSGIINTHCHPDHCGGNKYFQKKYKGLRIYSSRFEKPFIEDARLLPTCFCGGAEAFHGVATKALMPNPSEVTDIIEPYEDQKIEIDGEIFRIVTLPGHTHGMIGIITPDDVFYCGDAIFGAETVKKHGVLLYTHISDTLATFEKMSNLKLSSTVLYHGGEIQDIAPVCKDHAERIIAMKAKILEFVQESGSISLEALSQKVAVHYGVPNTVVALTLARTTVNAFITALEHDNAVSMSADNGSFVVKRAEANTVGFRK